MAKRDYELALKRLVDGKGNVINGDYHINNDTVAFEAGRKRGSIKSSRYPDLVAAIKLAGKVHNDKSVTQNQKQKHAIERKKSEITDLRQKYEAALNREAMLVIRLSELEQKLDEMEKRLANVVEFPTG